MICLYLVTRARETLIYHLRIDTNLIVTAAGTWEKAKKLQCTVWPLLPTTRVTQSNAQLPDQITDGVRGDGREWMHSYLCSTEAVITRNLSTPCSLLGASVNFACLLTLLALLCFWLLELCS